MKHFLIITTGGTIASTAGENGLTPTLSAEELLGFLPDVRKKCTISLTELCRIDSTNMSPDIWLSLVRLIRREYAHYDGFLVVHGTDTMAYTSAMLSYLIQGGDKPIVLTGAQRPIGHDSTDALDNLRDSITFMLAGDCGVFLVFGGRVIAGTRAKKVNSLSYQAFVSVNYPDVAVVQERSVVRFLPPEPATPVRFFEQLNSRVFLLKLTPATPEALVETLLERYDGIVVEGFGTGGLPDALSETLAKCQGRYPRGQKVLVITTQVLQEGSHMAVYAVGRSLDRRVDYLEALDMNLEAVVTKLMWLLADHHGDWDALRDGFYRTINHDILRK